MPLTIAPLLASITITSTTTYTPANNLLECNLSISADGRASKFDILLDNRTNTYTNIQPGEIVDISVGKSLSSMQALFSGVIERKEISRPSLNQNYLTLGGTDYSVKLLNTIVPGTRGDTGSYHPDLNHQSGWFIDQIVIDLVSKHTPEITTNNVNSTSSYIRDLMFSYIPLSDALKELADLAPLYNYYVDNTKDLHFFYEETKDSGVTIDTSLIKSLTIETDIQNTKNRVFFLGGDRSFTDISYTGVSSSINTYSAYQAVQFTPVQPILKELWLHIGKTGSPAVELRGEVLQDSGDQPKGAVLRLFSIDAAKIAAADWHIVNIDYEPLQTGVKHWVVIYISPNHDVNNTYTWSHDGGTSGVNASAYDGLTWTVRTSSYRPAIKTIYTEPIVTIGEDASVSKYGALETTISKPDINDFDQANAMGQRYAMQYGKARTEINASIYPPDNLPTPGHLITLSDSVSGASGQYIVTQMDYNIQGVETHDLSMRCFRFE